MYLFDTNILSEIRKINDPKTPPQFTAWFDSIDLDRCHLCVITLLEIEQGICACSIVATKHNFCAWENG